MFRIGRTWKPETYMYVYSLSHGRETEREREQYKNRQTKRTIILSKPHRKTLNPKTQV
jgi:ribosomal protein S10